jgi:uncharacterized protein (TIGR03067 family)
MYRVWAAALLVASGIGYVAADDGKELAALDGTWAVVAQTENGEAGKPDEFKGATFVFQAGKMSARLDGKEVGRSSFTIDPGKSPKQIDIVYGSGPAKGKTARGIYKLDGEKLVVCEAAPGKDRPTAFESKTGSGVALTTFQRRKDQK